MSGEARNSGMRALLASVSSRAATDADVERSLAAMLRVAAAVRPGQVASVA